jgi:hypothetical protein
MIQFLLKIFIAILIATPAIAEDEIFAGVLDFGCEAESNGPACNSPHSLYSAPQNNAAVIKNFSGKTLQYETPDPMFETIEFAYEINGLSVQSVDGAFYQVRYDGKPAWIRKSEGITFMPYPEILFEKLTYFNGPEISLFSIPDLSSAEIETFISDDDDSIPVKILEKMTDKEGRIWLHVSVLDQVCERAEHPQIVKTGWIEAYKNGKNTVWYYARGC